MILFSHVFKSYKDHVVLSDLSLEIYAGEFVVLVGESGVGKSTVINLLIGEEKPEAGSVSVDGMRIDFLKANELQLYRRQLGIVFQDYKLLHKKTIFENIAFALEVCGSSDSEIDSKVHEVIALVGLQTKEDHFPEDLSGGEQQRVAIARALVHNPKLIIADEPTGNLDPRNTKEIVDLFQQINKKKGVTIVLTTHDESIIQQLKERVVVLKDGKVEKIQGKGEKIAI